MKDITTGTRAAIRIERDVPYGEGSTGFGSARPGTRALLMDVYLPAAEARAAGRPALVLSASGAFNAPVGHAVMAMITFIPASAASMIASAAKAGGTKMIEVSAPVF